MTRAGLRRLLLLGAGAAALAGAGVAGAVVVGNVTSIERGEWARLGPTDVYCEAYVDKRTDRPAFDCAYWQGSHRVGRSYSALVDELGVEVDYWDMQGRKYREIETFLNP